MNKFGINKNYELIIDQTSYFENNNSFIFDSTQSKLILHPFEFNLLELVNKNARGKWALKIYTETPGCDGILVEWGLILDEIMVTAIDEKREMPDEFRLDQNYPNPFNPSTNITYSLPHDLSNRNMNLGNGIDVSLIVYDILGRIVTVLVNERQLPGKYSVNFDAESGNQSIAGGLYIYTLQAGDYQTSKKCLLIK